MKNYIGFLNRVVLSVHMVDIELQMMVGDMKKNKNGIFFVISENQKKQKVLKKEIKKKYTSFKKRILHIPEIGRNPWKFEHL